jgi:protein-S-isoprenylcysteine O-methyltransferase Ste14
MGRTIVFIYGVVAYVISLGTLLYAIGFVGNVAVPKSIDDGPEEPFVESLLVDAVLLGLFAIQHSLMARQRFKKWWSQIVPRAAERSTYVSISGLLLLLLFWQWRALPGAVWELDNPTAQLASEALFWFGWLIALRSSFLIDHFDLFGLRQAYLYLRDEEHAPVRFKMPGLYQYVRHPLMLGFLIAFWATPVMTFGHFLFAIAMTTDILIGIHLEERDLMKLYGRAYQEYRRRVPMILPLPRKRPLR